VTRFIEQQRLILAACILCCFIAIPRSFASQKPKSMVQPMSIVQAKSSVQPISTISSVLQNLSEEDCSILLKGKPIIRSIQSSSEMKLVAFDSYAQALKEHTKSLKPNYITEFILVLTVPDATARTKLLDRLALAVADVHGYVHIPYYSVRQQTTYDLFDKMEVLSRTTIESGERIVVRQHMEPFDDFRAEYRYERRAGNLTFSGENLDSIIYSYRNLSAVSPHGMRWELYVFEKGEQLYAYGYGAVHAFDLFGLFRDRLEPSFMGRVSAFFAHIAQKLSLE